MTMIHFRCVFGVGLLAVVFVMTIGGACQSTHVRTQAQAQEQAEARTLLTRHGVTQRASTLACTYGMRARAHAHFERVPVLQHRLQLRGGLCCDGVAAGEVGAETSPNELAMV